MDSLSPYLLISLYTLNELENCLECLDIFSQDKFANY